ncbi:MAG: DUF2807 domain-containing protein [Prevotellaceae bacterium]|jgi:hypothetical protein|nr:DUF2807 domain-containing protein [Prevotellaceae bacterium]
MRKVFISLTVICTTLLCIAPCIAGTVVREDRKTESFSRISVSGCIEVYYTQNDSYSVAVEAREDYIGEIITKVEGRTLVVKPKGNSSSVKKNRIVKVHVSAPALDRIDISGVSGFHADSIRCDSPFQLKASGVSNAKITGLTVTGNADISASGNSNMNIKKLQAVECELLAEGVSHLNIDMELSGNLKAKASGASSMNLQGQANDIAISTSGVSNVNAKKLAYKSADIQKSDASSVSRK